MTSLTTTAPSARLPMRQLLPLLLAVFISLMGFGVVLPVFPFWGRAMGAGPELVTVALGAYSAGQFIGAQMWGKLSDRFGRRPALIGSILGLVLSYLYMAEASNIWMLGAARLVGGLMAGNIAVAFAYVGDVVEGPREAEVGLDRAHAARPSPTLTRAPPPSSARFASRRPARGAPLARPPSTRLIGCPPAAAPPCSRTQAYRVPPPPPAAPVRSSRATPHARRAPRR